MKKAQLLFFLLVSFALIIKAEQIPDDETQAKVQELYDFHKVIRTMWHDAWPEKDIALLKKLLPELESGVNNVTNAELPGILRDKKEKWDNETAQLVSYLHDYKSATVKNDEKALLNAAENLHMQFEKLVRLIRPVTKEIHAFHSELYKLYHYYYPEWDIEKIKSAVEKLVDLSLDIRNAEPPAKYGESPHKFSMKVSHLMDSVSILRRLLKNSEKKDEITEAIENMHNDYQELEHLFD